MQQTIHLLPLLDGSHHTPCGEKLGTVYATPEITAVTCDKCIELHDAYCEMMYERAAA